MIVRFLTLLLLASLLLGSAAAADEGVAELAVAHWPHADALGSFRVVNATISGAVVTVEWVVVDSDAFRGRIEVRRHLQPVLLENATVNASNLDGSMAIYGGKLVDQTIWRPESGSHVGAAGVFEPEGGNWATPLTGMSLNTTHFVGALSPGLHEVGGSFAVKIFGSQVALAGDGAGAGSYQTGIVRTGNLEVETWLYVRTTGGVGHIEAQGYAEMAAFSSAPAGAIVRGVSSAGVGIVVVLVLMGVGVSALSGGLRGVARFRTFMARFSDRAQAHLYYAEILAAQGCTRAAAWHLWRAMRVDQSIADNVDRGGVLRDAVRLLGIPERIHLGRFGR